MDLNSTAELIEDIRQGKMVILMDDEDSDAARYQLHGHACPRLDLSDAHPRAL